MCPNDNLENLAKTKNGLLAQNALVVWALVDASNFEPPSPVAPKSEARRFLLPSGARHLALVSRDPGGKKEEDGFFFMGFMGKNKPEAGGTHLFPSRHPSISKQTIPSQGHLWFEPVGWLKQKWAPAKYDANFKDGE